MKIINLGLFLLFLGYANLAQATNYWLDFDDQQTASHTEGSRGSWSDWADCEDIHGYGQSAPRGFFLWELGDPGNNDKALISCRTVETDGTFQSGSYTWSDPFFDLADTTGTRDETQTSMDKLPVGMKIYYPYSNQIVTFAFLESEADEIAEGDEVIYTETDSRATSDAFTLALSTSTAYEVVCDDGYVMTGMRVRYRSADWPYRGYTISGVQLHCTALHEQVF